MRTHQNIIVAHHLVWTGYGHWLANDIRGSGSTEIRQERFEELGPIHHGRKKIQPSRDELRAFHRKAEPLLQHELIWFDRPYSVFLYTPDEVEGRIKYVNDNFEKHNLPREIYPFVKQYDQWPFHNKLRKQ